MRKNIKIIGLGGIGSELCEKLCKFLYFKDQQYSIYLIDGDTYEDRNMERQNFKTIGNKALVKANELRQSYGYGFTPLEFKSYPCYVTEENIEDIINDNDYVFLGVDNHKTRRIVSNYCKTLNNIILISGGNEFTDGNVQIYIRKEGKDITANLTDYHPEITHAGDKLPDELSCSELQNSQPQLLFANAAVALIMCWAFYNIINDLDKENYKEMNGEIYFDIITMKMNSKIRKPKFN